MSSQSNETQVFYDVYKGFPTLGIWKVNDSGQKVGKTPVVSFGLNKAKAIMEHIEEVESWVEKQSSQRQQSQSQPQAQPQIDLNSLNPAQLQQLLALLGKK